ncbi:MAG TPA: glycosyltransferase family A protein [Patescibacteria group bacterium]|nr:glycosyltransferase family A protein [Patescibacteria group bacterium]
MLKKQKPLTLSIIIPVYNEENYLRACLESIATQSVAPDEVIVVDNNSTDSSVAIAEEFAFVRIITEAEQHQAYAQTTGFAAATSEIIGRIDADSILPDGWVENVKSHFSDNPRTVAITGGGIPYDMFLSRLSKFGFDTFFSISRFMSGHKLLWGANCAFRKDAWMKVADKTSLRQDIWEDFDLSFCLNRIGRIDLLDNIDVLASFRAVHKSLGRQITYQFRAVRTFAVHKGRLFSLLFLMVWSILLLAYPITVLDRYVLQPLLAGYGAFKTINPSFAAERTPKIDTTNNPRL